MRKITYENAKQLINAGSPVKAKISREMIPVATLSDLENLNHLKHQKVQDFELFDDPVLMPDTALKATLDDSIKLLYDGETIYSNHNGEEISFSSKLDVTKLIEYYRSCMLHDKCCVLYWKG